MILSYLDFYDFKGHIFIFGCMVKKNLKANQNIFLMTRLEAYLYDVDVNDDRDKQSNNRYSNFLFSPLFTFSPTSLDALVFSYLAPLVRVPFPSNTLQIHCKACENLVMFCSRILQRYFPQDPQGTSHSKAPIYYHSKCKLL